MNFSGDGSEEVKKLKKQLEAAIKDIPVEKAEEALSKCRELVMQVTAALVSETRHPVADHACKNTSNFSQVHNRDHTLRGSGISNVAMIAQHCIVTVYLHYASRYKSAQSCQTYYS